MTRGSLLVAALAIVAAAPGPAAAVEVTAPDLENRVLATGLDTPTAIAWTPDGRLLVTHKWGAVRLVNRRNAPFGRVILDISKRVATREDTGLMGIEVDPGFARNGFIYITYAYDPDPSAPGAPKTARLSRFKLVGDRIVGGARGEKVVLGRDSNGPCPPPANDVDCIPTDYSHTIGAVRAAADGTLWVSTGDGSATPGATSRSLRTFDERSYAGKLLHVDRKGRGVREHPFCPDERDLRLVCTKVFAKGFRNPFRFSLGPDGIPIVGDVGWGLREEIDLVRAGLNYGWPCYEGFVRTPGYDAFETCRELYDREGSPGAAEPPEHEYERPPEGAAVIVGPHFPEIGTVPPFRDAFFFGDYVSEKVFRVVGGIGSPPEELEAIATGLRSVDLRPGPGGTLGYVDIKDGAVGLIAYAPANKSPIASVQATPPNGASAPSREAECRGRGPGRRRALLQLAARRRQAGVGSRRPAYVPKARGIRGASGRQRRARCSDPRGHEGPRGEHAAAGPHRLAEGRVSLCSRTSDTPPARPGATRRMGGCRGARFAGRWSCTTATTRTSSGTAPVVSCPSSRCATTTRTRITRLRSSRSTATASGAMKPRRQMRLRCVRRPLSSPCSASRPAHRSPMAVRSCRRL